MRTIRTLLVFTVVSISGDALAEDATEVQAEDARAEAEAVMNQTRTMPLGGQYVIDGTKLFDGWFLGAERIVFKSGAKLVFSERALERRNTFFIAADEIVAEDPGKPGRISWARSGGGSQAPPTAGQAASGADGQGAGAHGAPGHTGRQGNEGHAGVNAPSLTIFARRVVGSGQEIAFSGQDGSKGGVGQRGGDGGKGEQGLYAAQNPFNCLRGPGHGGNGGAGGKGGPGGVGGRGGAGGRVMIASLPENLTALSGLFRVGVSPGKGGPGGDGGDGGVGGGYGEAGAHAPPYCRAKPERRGEKGPPGEKGPSGPAGPDGIQGDFLVTGFTTEQFDRILHGGGP